MAAASDAPNVVLWSTSRGTQTHHLQIGGLTDEPAEHRPGGEAITHPAVRGRAGRGRRVWSRGHHDHSRGFEHHAAGECRPGRADRPDHPDAPRRGGAERVLAATWWYDRRRFARRRSFGAQSPASNRNVSRTGLTVDSRSASVLPLVESSMTMTLLPCPSSRIVSRRRSGPLTPQNAGSPSTLSSRNSGTDGIPFMKGQSCFQSGATPTLITLPSRPPIEVRCGVVAMSR